MATAAAAQALQAARGVADRNARLASKQHLVRMRIRSRVARLAMQQLVRVQAVSVGGRRYFYF